jgi:hypothetical protein
MAHGTACMGKASRRLTCPAQLWVQAVHLYRRGLHAKQLHRVAVLPAAAAAAGAGALAGGPAGREVEHWDRHAKAGDVIHAALRPPACSVSEGGLLLQNSAGGGGLLYC